MEPKDIKSLLLRSVMEDLSAEEETRLDEALQRSETLQKEKERLLLTRKLVQNATPPPDPQFSERVLRQLETGRKEAALVVRLFPKVAVACIAVILALGLFLYFEAGSLSTESLIGLEDLSLEEAVALTEY